MRDELVRLRHQKVLWINTLEVLQDLRRDYLLLATGSTMSELAANSNIGTDNKS